MRAHFKYARLLIAVLAALILVSCQSPTSSNITPTPVQPLPTASTSVLPIVDNSAVLLTQQLEDAKKQIEQLNATIDDLNTKNDQLYQWLQDAKKVQQVQYDDAGSLGDLCGAYIDTLRKLGVQTIDGKMFSAVPNDDGTYTITFQKYVFDLKAGVVGIYTKTDVQLTYPTSPQILVMPLIDYNIGPNLVYSFQHWIQDYQSKKTMDDYSVYTFCIQKGRIIAVYQNFIS